MKNREQEKQPITYGEFIAPYVVMAEYLAFSAFINIVAFEIVKGWFEIISGKVKDEI